MRYKIFTKSQKPSWKTKIKPGNFIVTNGEDLFDKITHIFTASPWNHAALITSANGELIELMMSGIQKKNISEYQHKKFYIVAIDMNKTDRKHVVDYANFMLNKHESYGFLTVMSIIFKIITKSRLVIKLDGTMICSEFVARALAQGGIIWDKDPSLITPADLYNRFIKEQN